MKLSEIKNTSAKTINESVIPVHVSMPLARILDDGKITDNVQLFTLAGLIDMFKNGTPPWPRNHSFEFAVGSDQLDAVKKLSETEIKEVTQWVLQQLSISGSYESIPRCSSSMSISDWIKLVIKKQD